MQKNKKRWRFVDQITKIVGVTVSVYGEEICGIYGLAIKKEYRKHEVGKEYLDIYQIELKDMSKEIQNENSNELNVGLKIYLIY